MYANEDIYGSSSNQATVVVSDAHGKLNQDEAQAAAYEFLTLEDFLLKFLIVRLYATSTWYPKSKR